MTIDQWNSLKSGDFIRSKKSRVKREVLSDSRFGCIKVKALKPTKYGSVETILTKSERSIYEKVPGTELKKEARRRVE